MDGPTLLLNNFIEAASQQFFFGGATSDSPDVCPPTGAHPYDIEIRRNNLWKPLQWMVGTSHPPPAFSGGSIVDAWIAPQNGEGYPPTLDATYGCQIEAPPAGGTQATCQVPASGGIVGGQVAHVSEVAFIKEILDTARNSKSKGTLLLQFLFGHVIRLSSADLGYRGLRCSCGQMHAAHSAAWLAPVKGRKWVYKGEHVSAVTLSRLMKDDVLLMERLADDAIFTFLARLDVSPSELRKAALDLPEQEMAKLERAMQAVLSAADNDPKQLEQIAELLASAPELLVEFEKKKEATERIHRNRLLGSLVEELFNELFRSEEIRTMGLRLRREPIGSDFAVENDFIREEQENLFSVAGANKDLLIELKSTLGNTATMTHTQAGVAAGRSDSFVLCVVPLEDRQPTVDIIRTHSRFVPSIGQRLHQKVDEVRAIRNLQELTVQPTDGVQVVVEQGEFRYRVSESVWTADLSFEDFKTYPIRFFEKTVVI